MGRWGDGEEAQREGEGGGGWLPKGDSSKLGRAPSRTTASYNTGRFMPAGVVAAVRGGGGGGAALPMNCRKKKVREVEMGHSWRPCWRGPVWQKAGPLGGRWCDLECGLVAAGLPNLSYSEDSVALSQMRSKCSPSTLFVCTLPLVATVPLLGPWRELYFPCSVSRSR